MTISNARRLLMLGLLSYGGLAVSSDLNINGNVVASPCIIDADSANQTIDFGQARSRDFIAAGSGGEWKPFSIQLTHCPSSTRQVKVLLTGTPSAESGFYANIGSAPNVEIQIVDGNNMQNLAPGSQLTVDVDGRNQTASFPLASRLYSSKGKTSAGTISGVLQLDFTYQ